MRNSDPAPHELEKVYTPDRILTFAGSFRKQLSNDENITFYYAQGFLESRPPTWLEAAVDGPPYLKFYEWESDDLEEFGDHIRSLGPPAETPSPFPLAEFLKRPPEPWSVGVTLDYLYNVIEDEGPFDGVIGISEGASVAATLLIEDIQACKAKQTQSRFRCGIFYIGAPAWWADGSRAWLAEEHGQVIDLPTCHVMGMNDIFKEGAEALLKICNSDKALVIADPGGHRIPQDHETNKLMADWVREQERNVLER